MSGSGDLDDPSIAYLGDPLFRESEMWSHILLAEMTGRLRDPKRSLASPDAACGQDFDRASSEMLFSGKTGRGPLRIAWDTNILIDFIERGHEIWWGRPIAGAEEDSAQLEALQILVAVWLIRDIRLQILPGSPTDAKRGLPRTKVERRHRAADDLEDALAHAFERLPELNGKHVSEDALSALGDTRLVREAIVADCDVFLTRDKGILRAENSLRSLGIAVLDPQSVVEGLAESGALHPFLYPGGRLPGPVDCRRSAHQIRVADRRPRVTDLHPDSLGTEIAKSHKESYRRQVQALLGGIEN